MKNIRIRRESYIYEDHVKLCFTLIRRNNRVKYSFKELAKEVFTSLNEEEIRNVFSEKLKEIAKIEECWTGFEIEVKIEKDKERIKEAHDKVMKEIKDILKELKQKEEERNLGNWLWRDKIFRI